VRTDRNNTIAAPKRNLTKVADGLAMFEAINQAENSAKNITPTSQESDGQAITMRASADQDAMFLANNIQRRFKYSEATIANRSKTPPE
jgi:hypothetical protein